MRAPKVASVSGSESARPVCTYGVLVVLLSHFVGWRPV